MRKILIFLILICLLPTHAFASLEFFALLPNPAGDDTLGEYIEIRNTGCQDIDIGGYHLYDAANNTYTIPSGTTIGVHENISFPYRDTKISLNNSGIETITLATSTGEIIDTESYSTTQKDNIVISLNPVDEDCSVIPPIESNTGTTSTGTTDSGDINSGSTDSGTTSTGTIDTGSGASETSGGQATGTTSTGSFVPQDDGSTSTGTTNTGSTDSGTIDSVPTNTGVINEIIFPEIVPTRQEPTNATLSGNVWDCGLNQPCRVNVTFDPIFTGSFLSKNYLCEVVTETGTLTTCNPNTLYFSTDSSFSFRLTSKLDPSQSMTMTWGVRFTALQDSNSTGGTTNTGSFVPQDDVNANTGTIEDSHTGVTFPQIVPTFQNYTNTTNSGDTLTCVTSPCRVNFTLDPIFTGSFLEKNYTCEIHYGTGVYDSCNPPQLYPIGTGSIEIVLTHKVSSQKEVKTIEILQNITIASVSPKTPTNIAPADMGKDTTKPVAIIDFDGTLKSYYEQVNDYEFNCYAMTCSVNLTAERSYDPDGSDIRYLWIYGQNEIKTTRDPGTRKYTIGDHTIVLRVIDTAGNYDEIRYIIHVLGPRTEEEKKMKIQKERSGDQKTSGGQKKKKKKKLKRMDFFDPPIIALQDSKFAEGDDRYLCRTTAKTCSLNLTLSGAEKGIIYTWYYDDGDIVTSKNPRSKSFAPGKHEITVSASYSGSTDILWTQILSVQVDHIAKPKKAKKPKPKKITASKKSANLSLIPTAYASGVPTDASSRGDISSFLIFVSIISMIVGYQRRTYLSKKREQ